MNRAGITRHTTFHLHPEPVGDAVPPVAVEVVLTYRAADPLAAHLTFRGDRGRDVLWVISRDLLNEGLTEDAGEGDVRVRPCPTEPDAVEILLASPSGSARFTTPRWSLSSFLDETYLLVHEGQEYAHLDMDRALAALLDAAAGAA